MLFVRSFHVIITLVIIMSLGFQGCSITAQKNVQSAYKTKTASQSLDSQEKAYTYYCTGYFFMMERDWENAAQYFERALLLNHSSENIIRHLATCYFQLGKNEKAIRYVKILAKINPQEFSVHYMLATLYETVGKYNEAVAEYENARRCKVTEIDHVFLADTLYRLANLYMQDGMIEKGAECYQSMFDMKLVGDSAKIYYEIGQRYFENNNIQKALEYFLKVKETDPGLNSIHFYLTLCYDALYNYNDAVKEAGKFLEKEPDNWIMHFALSEIYGKTKNEQKRSDEIKIVQELLKKNIDRGSKNPKEYFLLSQIYRNQQSNEEAISIVERMKLIPLDKETTRDVHYLLANLYYENQEYDRVEEELQMTLKLDSDFHEANNFLGYLFVENNKNLDEAIQLINKALKAQPKNGAYLDSLGWAYYKKAKIEKRDDYLILALQKLLKAIQLMEEPDIYEHIGDVQYSLGNWDEAVVVWGKAQMLYTRMQGHEVQSKNITTKLETIKRLISEEKTGLKITANHKEVENCVQP